MGIRNTGEHAIAKYKVSEQLTVEITWKDLNPSVVIDALRASPQIRVS